jgi:hypothetical protein
VHELSSDHVAEEETEILDGWLVDSVKIIDEIVDDEPVSYAVWVRKAIPRREREGPEPAQEQPETPLQVTAETRQKIDRLPERLSDEFADVAPQEIQEEVDELAEALLEEARFEDFVPLLAYRQSRDQLLEEGHEPSRDR